MRASAARAQNLPEAADNAHHVRGGDAAVEIDLALLNLLRQILGAEGIEAVPGRDLLIEDQPAAFADAVSRLLVEPAIAARIGQSARQLAVESYAWSGAARALEGFHRRILEVGS